MHRQKHRLFGTFLLYALLAPLALTSLLCLTACNDPSETDPSESGSTSPSPDPEQTIFEEVDYENIYIPTKNALEHGVTFDFDPDNITMDLSASNAKIARRENLKPSIQKAIDGTAFARFDRVMVLEGSGDFALAGLIFGMNNGYSIEIEYYAAKTPANSRLVALSEEKEPREVATDLFQEGHHVLNIDYRVGSMENALAFSSDDKLDVYIGRISVQLATKGPTLSQMNRQEGYDWPIDQLKIGDSSRVKVGKIKDSAVKKALLNKGLDEDDFVVNTTGGELAGFDRSLLYVPGYKYTITIEYYAKDTGGYLIALDSTSGNHGFAGPGAFESGYHKSTYTWEVGKNGEYALTFFSIPEIYIVSLNFKLESPDQYSATVFAPPSSYRIPSPTQINDGFTFDFTAACVPNLDGGTWMGIAALPNGVDRYETLLQTLTPENGFSGAYAYDVSGELTLSFLKGALIPGKSYTITLRVYAPSGKPSMILLPMNASGTQSGSDSACQVKLVSGMKKVYDLTFTVKPTSDVSYYMTYRSTVPYIVSSISVKAPDSYKAPQTSTSHPEYGYVSSPVTSPAEPTQVSLLDLITSFVSSIFRVDQTTDNGGMSSSAIVGIDEATFDDILYPVPKNAEFDLIFNAADYGISPENSGEENSQAFDLLLRLVASDKESQKRIYFPEGIYKFARTLTFDGIENAYFSSATASSTFTVLMTNWVQGISVNACKNIHFNGMKLDYQTPSTISGVIVDSSGSTSVTIRVHDEFDLTRPEYKGGNFMFDNRSYQEYIFDQTTGKYVPDPAGNLLYGKDCLVSASYNKEKNELTIKMNASARPQDQMGKTLKFIEGTEVALAYTMYEYFGFYATASENVYFEQVTFHHTLGMAMGFSHCHNLYLNGVRLTPPEGSSRHVTATADGFHPAMTTGEIVITNSLFELSHDDAMNVKGAYQDIVASQPHKIFYSPQTDVGTMPGDIIEIYRASDYKYLGSYTVESVDPVSFSYTVKEKIEGDLSGQRLCNITRSNSLKVQNTFIGNKRNRGMLLQCRNIEILNCTFANIVHTPIQVLSEGLVYAVEGIMPGNVRIADCKFIGNRGTDILVYARGLEGDRTAGSIRGVTIENNFFSGQDSTPIEINAASNGTVKNNLFAANTSSYVGSAVYVWSSSDITLTDNVIAKKEAQSTTVLKKGNGASKVTEQGNTVVSVN